MSTTDEQTPVVIADASVFLGRSRLWANVRVEISDTKISAFRKSAEIGSFDIVEVVTAGVAWDVMHSGQRARVVVQTGCGCGGMRRYTPDASYSGTLTP